jgi:uncharacterized ion transporter superfamily protein YfcC
MGPSKAGLTIMVIFSILGLIALVWGVLNPEYAKSGYVIFAGAGNFIGFGIISLLVRSDLKK